jgi:hypothetical protein
MNNQSASIFSGIYSSGFQQLFDAVNACLCKAEALAVTAATTDFESFESNIINNYMWALSDIVREAKCLHARYGTVK